MVPTDLCYEITFPVSPRHHVSREGYSEKLEYGEDVWKICPEGNG